ncbi:penicillin-binding protein, partial [Salmonella enterica subsp. enterica serovar Enteritidis str. 76-2651]
MAYTAGVAPASNPRFALVVVINNPQNGAYYGGAVSA